jgi:hypothetical protein
LSLSHTHKTNQKKGEQAGAFSEAIFCNSVFVPKKREEQETSSPLVFLKPLAEKHSEVQWTIMRGTKKMSGCNNFLPQIYVAALH